MSACARRGSASIGLNRLTSKALQELLQLLTVFLPADARVPKSVRQLKQFFLKKYPEQCPAMQKYCKLCQRLLLESEMCACNAGHSEFVTVPVGPQLQARLESKPLCKLVMKIY